MIEVYRRLLSEAFDEDIKCPSCDGEGLVCEDHPEVPWKDGDNCCGGAGSPCSKCHPVMEHIAQRERERRSDFGFMAMDVI